jgi:hypothetical protein
MTIPVAYRDQLLAQFIESSVTFIYKKRKVAELEAKVETTPLTANEANILSHYQIAIARDRATFQIWKKGLQDHTKFNNEFGNPFPPGSYTLAQIKTFILNNRVAILNYMRERYDIEITRFNVLKDEETLAAITDEQKANLPTLLAELDNRIAKRQMWRDLVIELRDMLEADYSAEAELG